MANPNAFSSHNESDDDDTSSEKSPVKPVPKKAISFLIKPPTPPAEQQPPISELLKTRSEDQEEPSEGEDDSEDTATEATPKRRAFKRSSSLGKFVSFVNKDAAASALKNETDEPADQEDTATEVGMPAAEIEEDLPQEAEPAPGVGPETPAFTQEADPDEDETPPTLPPPIALPPRPPAGTPPTPNTPPIPPVPPRPVTPNVPQPPVPPAQVAANMVRGGGAAPNTANTTTIIERRRSGILPAVAVGLFVNYLDRRKHRQSTRKIEDLKKDLKATQKQMSTNQSRTRNAEQQAKNRTDEQQQRLRAMERTIQSPKAEATPIIEYKNDQKMNHEPKYNAQPVRVAEILAAKAIEYQKPLSHTQEAPPLPAPETVLGEKNATIQEKVTEAQQAQEIPQKLADIAEFSRLAQKEVAPDEAAKPVRETTIDRRHEVKDDASQPAAGASAARPNLSGGPQAAPLPPPMTTPPTKSSQTSAQSALIPAPTANSTHELYKQSVRAGILVGVSIIILGVIAYNLLR